jgi:hypothetical protein
MITLHNITEYDNEISEVIHLLDKAMILYNKVYFKDEHHLSDIIHNCYIGGVDYVESFKCAVIKLTNIFKKVREDESKFRYDDIYYKNALYSIKIIYNIINACNEYIKSTYTYPNKVQKAVIKKSNFIKDAKNAARHINLI